MDSESNIIESSNNINLELKKLSHLNHYSSSQKNNMSEGFLNKSSINNMNDNSFNKKSFSQLNVNSVSNHQNKLLNFQRNDTKNLE